MMTYQEYLYCLREAAEAKTEDNSDETSRLIRAVANGDLQGLFSGHKLTDISRIFGIPYRTLQNWTSGKKTPPPYVVQLLAYVMIADNAERIREKEESPAMGLERIRAYIKAHENEVRKMIKQAHIRSANGQGKAEGIAAKIIKNNEPCLYFKDSLSAKKGWIIYKAVPSPETSEMVLSYPESEFAETNQSLLKDLDDCADWNKELQKIYDRIDELINKLNE